MLRSLTGRCLDHNRWTLGYTDAQVQASSRGLNGPPTGVRMGGPYGVWTDQRRVQRVHSDWWILLDKERTANDDQWRYLVKLVTAPIMIMHGSGTLFTLCFLSYSVRNVWAIAPCGTVPSIVKLLCTNKADLSVRETVLKISKAIAYWFQWFIILLTIKVCALPPRTGILHDRFGESSVQKLEQSNLTLSMTNVS